MAAPRRTDIVVTMNPPPTEPSPGNIDPWRDLALSYLAGQLRDRAPKTLGQAIHFPWSPLEGEGTTVIFPFRAKHGDEAEADYYVVVGRTEPNYYPAYGLSPEDAFHLHLGTRFMLVLGVAQRFPRAEDDFDMHRDARMIVDRVAPGEPIEALSLEASFDVEGQLHAVLRCRIRDAAVYIMAAHAPMGFSTHSHLPPQVAYRIHIGRALLHEAKPPDE